MIVNDLDRPDVNGVPPKMQSICAMVQEALNGSIPFLTIATNDNLMSSICVRGSFDAKETWTNGIWQNSRYFIFHLCPMKGKRYYSPEDPHITVEMTSCSHKMGKKFRKYTNTPEKCIAKIREWIYCTRSDYVSNPDIR